MENQESALPDMLELPGMSEGGRKSRKLIIVGVAVLLIAGCVSAFFLFVNKDKEAVVEEEPVTEEENMEGVVPEETVEPEEPVVDMSDWHNFLYKEFWFEFKYPGDWNINEEEGRVELTMPGERESGRPAGDIVVSVLPNPEGVTMEEYFDGSSPSKINYFSDAMQAEEITVGGLPAKRFYGVAGITGGNVTAVLFVGNIIVVTDNIGVMETDYILSTVEFIKPVVNEHGWLLDIGDEPGI